MADVLYPKASPCPSCGAASPRITTVRDLALRWLAWRGPALAHVGAALYECQTRTCGVDQFYRSAPGESLVQGESVDYLCLPSPESVL